jgi:hypothetical protein
MKKSSIMLTVMAILFAGASAFTAHSNKAFTVDYGNRPSDSQCISGTLQQSASSCGTTDKGKGRCTVQLQDGLSNPIVNAFQTNTCVTPLYIQ